MILSTHEQLLAHKGAKVTCKIWETKIHDARIQVEDENIFICQNERDGVDANDKLGYKSSWKISSGSCTYEFDNRNCTKIQLVEEETEYNIGDIISTEGLVPFEDKHCKKLGLKKGDMVVNLSEYFKKGEILELIYDDKSRVPKFSNGIKERFVYIIGIAPLPKMQAKPSKQPVKKETYETIIRRDD